MFCLANDNNKNIFNLMPASLSEKSWDRGKINLGHGFAKFHERLVEQYKKNIYWLKMEKNLGLLPTTVFNIVKGFRESGEITIRIGKAGNYCWKSDLRAIRQHWMRNCHTTVISRAAWAQEYLRNSMQKCYWVLWPWAQLRWTERQ